MSIKIIDRRNASEAGEYDVAFAARDEVGSYEHAVVVWYYSDPNGRRPNRRAAGFYLAGTGDMYDLVIGGVPGQVEDDSRQKISQELIMLVNKSVFDKSIKAESQYKDATYWLLSNDCVSFVEAVAGLLPEMKLPSRLTNAYPSTYIAALSSGNN